MSKSKLDNNQNSLGDAVHSLSKSDQIGGSKDRIISILKDEDSVASRRTKHWCLSNKHFEKNTSYLTKRIHGFRPKSREFKQKAYEILLLEMETNYQSKGWRFYQYAYIDFLRKDRVELTQLLDLEEGTGLVNSEELIKRIILKAPTYVVGADDIEELYENWYFTPNPEFQRWIKDLKSDSRSIENKHHIQDIEVRFSTFKKELDNFQSSFVSHESINNKLTPLINEINELNKRFKSEQLSSSEYSKKLFSEIADLNTKINQLQNEEINKSKELLELNKTFEEIFDITQNNLEEQLESIRKTNREELASYSLTIDKKLESINLSSVPKIVGPQSTSTYQFTNKTIYRDGLCNSNTVDIDEKQLIKRYLELLENTSVNSTEKETIINHCILKCSDVIDCQSLDYIDPWIHALGWDQHVLEAAVDPNWTNYTAWQDVASKFLMTDNIRILILHCFNNGYIEGYLKPFLLLFNREPHNLKKIILVSSGSEPKPDLINDGFTLLENHKEKISNFRKIKDEVYEPITLESFEAWSEIRNEESEDYAQIICGKLVEFSSRENIKIHKAVYETLYLIMCSYLNCGYGLDSKTKKLFFSAMLPSYMCKDKVSKFLLDL